ncbi:MAG: hypothetical protein UU67_C0016G0012 [Candidatus Daviesbacteria bacterium GW2011_GWB1_41_5]|uniref:DUF5659 domain-containing protein n=1 Tax=Candidatus Daviesbacteria bacterium GW2011_GWB1_41_5 TaxID=1618429 RepID=A0A0G0WM07_9BACT|nr:MAG: hypothetical protein UU67_C0016G0012 [Candidatus Daviesbacteria bacterium GW2011_GWB1_41_5]
MSELADNYYSTAHLALAAAISLFYPIDSIDRNNPNKALFVFKIEEDTDKLIEAFWKDELKVSPLAYFNRIKELKTRLYEEKL